MSTNFSVIPVRQNSTQTDASWWNSLRTAGSAVETIVNAIIGGGGSIEVTQAILNNQSGAAVTGLALSSTYKKHIIDYWVKRISTSGGGVTVMESGQYTAIYDGTTWSIGRSGGQIGLANFSLTIDSGTGAIDYVTDNQAGTYDTVNSKIGYTLTTRGS